MATTTKKESSLGKEKRGNSPSSSSNGRRASTGSTETKVPNYLKPTISSRNEIAIANIKNLKKSGPQDTTSQRPDLLRRRSFDRPPSAARVHKALTSPAREKPKTLRSASFSSKTTIAATAPKSSLEKVPKKTNAGKSETLSSSRSMKKTTTSTKKGSGSNKPPSSTSSHEKKEAQNLETKNENNEETLDDHHQQVEEVLKDDDHEGEIGDFETPKSEESDELSDVVDITPEVKSVEQGNDLIPFPADHIIPGPVSQEHNVPPTEEKMEEEKSHDHFQKGIENDEDKEEEEENHSKEATINEEKIPHEEAKTETEDHEREGEEDSATENVATTKEIGEENQVQSTEEDDESSKEEIVEGEQVVVEEAEAEAEAEATNIVVTKRQVEAGQGKKESPTAYNDVIEETASKLREERKNKVRALVGAFETVIDKETSNAK